MRVTADLEISEGLRDYLERISAMFSAGDPRAVHATYGPDAVVIDHRPLGRQEWRGWEEIGAVFAQAREVFSDLALKIHVVDVAGDVLLTRDTYDGHAAIGGGEVQMEWWCVGVLRDGRTAHEEHYASEAAARAAFTSATRSPAASAGIGSRTARAS